MSGPVAAARSGAGTTTAAKQTPLDQVKALVEKYSVVVFSKTYCPFCRMTKSTLAGELDEHPELAKDVVVVELDNNPDGAELQAALASWTGQRTVPNTFINGVHIGGNDDLTALNRSGELAKLLKAASAKL